MQTRLAVACLVAAVAVVAWGVAGSWIEADAASQGPGSSSSVVPSSSVTTRLTTTTAFRPPSTSAFVPSTTARVPSTTTPRLSTTTTRPRSSTSVTGPTTASTPTTTASTTAPGTGTSSAPATTVAPTTQAPGTTLPKPEVAAENASSNRLRWIVGGLVGVAAVIGALTFLYWRHTRPVDDWDGYGGGYDPYDPYHDEAETDLEAGDEGIGPDAALAGTAYPPEPATVTVRPTGAALAGAAVVGAAAASGVDEELESGAEHDDAEYGDAEYDDAGLEGGGLDDADGADGGAQVSGAAARTVVTDRNGVEAALGAAAVGGVAGPAADEGDEDDEYAGEEYAGGADGDATVVDDLASEHGGDLVDEQEDAPRPPPVALPERPAPSGGITILGPVRRDDVDDGHVQVEFGDDEDDEPLHIVTLEDLERRSRRSSTRPDESEGSDG